MNIKLVLYLGEQSTISSIDTVMLIATAAANQQISDR